MYLCTIINLSIVSSMDTLSTRRPFVNSSRRIECVEVASYTVIHRKSKVETAFDFLTAGEVGFNIAISL